VATKRLPVLVLSVTVVTLVVVVTTAGFDRRGTLGV
jgi:hypothetical protein